MKNGWMGLHYKLVIYFGLIIRNDVIVQMG